MPSMVILKSNEVPKNFNIEHLVPFSNQEEHLVHTSCVLYIAYLLEDFG